MMHTLPRHLLVPGVKNPRKLTVLGIARRVSLEHPERGQLDVLRRRIIDHRTATGIDTTVEERMEAELLRKLRAHRAPIAQKAAC